MGVGCPRILDRCGIGAFRATEHATDRVAGSHSPPIPTSRTAGMGVIRALVPCLNARVVVAARALAPRYDRLFGFVRLGRRSRVMMCPEPAGTSWAAARCSRSPPWCIQGLDGLRRRAGVELHRSAGAVDPRRPSRRARSRLAAREAGSLGDRADKLCGNVARLAPGLRREAGKVESVVAGED